MSSNRYAHAGWLAIMQAVLFPLSFVLGIIEQGVVSGLADINRPFLGPSDFIMLGFSAIAVYLFVVFKRLLNKEYGYHDLDLLIYVSIGWVIMFQLVGLGLGVYMMLAWPVDKVLMAIIYIVFMTGAMVSVGIVDILIAVKLLRVKDNLGEYIRAYAYISMTAGILEVTVLLSPLALLLIPVTWIILALIFFKDQPRVEYV